MCSCKRAHVAYRENPYHCGCLYRLLLLLTSLALDVRTWRPKTLLLLLLLHSHAEPQNASRVVASSAFGVVRAERRMSNVERRTTLAYKFSLHAHNNVARNVVFVGPSRTQHSNGRVYISIYICICSRTITALQYYANTHARRCKGTTALPSKSAFATCERNATRTKNSKSSRVASQQTTQ